MLPAPLPLFLEMFILKGFKSFVLEVLIPMGLRTRFSEVRIPKGLTKTQMLKPTRRASGISPTTAFIRIWRSRFSLSPQRGNTPSGLSRTHRHGHRKKERI